MSRAHQAGRLSPPDNALVICVDEKSQCQALERTQPRHRHQEFLSFLREIDTAVPPELDIHCIVDNYATPNHPLLKAFA